MAIILITHDLGVIAEMADEVVVMYLGRVVEQGPVDDDLPRAEAPLHARAAALDPEHPCAEPRTRLPTIAGSHPAPVQPAARLPLPSALPRLHAGALRPAPSRRSSALGEDQRDGALLPLRRTRCDGRSRASGATLLEVESLQKFFPIRRGFLRRVVGHVRAVDDVSFDIERGETLALVGESGCGKTTTSRCILRALTPTAGADPASARRTAPWSTWPRCRSAQLRPLRRQMQMIFQDPFSSLNPRMTLLDIIGEPLLVNGVRQPAGAARPRAPSCCDLVGCRPRVHAAASRTPSAAASASASASRARWR